MGRLGIVLWRNPKSGQALIWCDDQKDLVILDNNICGGGHLAFKPKVNDRVLFEERSFGGRRAVAWIYAHWSEENTAELDELLRRSEHQIPVYLRLVSSTPDAPSDPRGTAPRPPSGPSR